MPGAPDLAAILVTMQHGFAQQGRSMAALKDELKVEFKGHLASVVKHASERVNRLEQTLRDEIGNIQTGQQRQFDSLEMRLKQLEAAQVQQPSTLSSKFSMPAPEISLPLAAQLAAANPARQNPKLIGQALSAALPALKSFQPKNASALVEEEQWVTLVRGPWWSAYIRGTFHRTVSS